jgi:flavin reductase (DIM6/NTAB) family NADH-FMN oxidoreductase RutF
MNWDSCKVKGVFEGGMVVLIVGIVVRVSALKLKFSLDEARLQRHLQCEMVRTYIKETKRLEGL